MPHIRASVRLVAALLNDSFRPRLAAATLAVRLTVPLSGSVEDSECWCAPDAAQKKASAWSRKPVETSGARYRFFLATFFFVAFFFVAFFFVAFFFTAFFLAFLATVFFAAFFFAAGFFLGAAAGADKRSGTFTMVASMPQQYTGSSTTSPIAVTSNFLPHTLHPYCMIFSIAIRFALLHKAYNPLSRGLNNASGRNCFSSCLFTQAMQ